MTLTAYLLGWISALLVGMSKTGLPGVSLPAILLMTEAFSDDAKLHLGAILPVLLVGDVFAVTWYRHRAEWKRLWGLFPFVALGMVPGFLILRLIQGNQLRPVLGALIIGLLCVEAYRRWREARRRALAPLPLADELPVCVCRQGVSDGSAGRGCPSCCAQGWQPPPPAAPRWFSSSWWFMAFMGGLAGFATMVANAAMPVMTIYLLSRGLLKKQFIGTAAWFFFLVNLSKLPICYNLGVVTPRTVQFGLIVAPLTIVGGLLGVYVLARIPQRLFDVLALSLAGMAGVWLIVVQPV